MIYIRPGAANRLNRSINRTGPQHPRARRVVSQATVRDTDPVTGSHAIMHEFSSNAVARKTTSLNIVLTDGSLGKAFHWGVMGFGWDDGIL